MSQLTAHKILQYQMLELVTAQTR